MTDNDRREKKAATIIKQLFERSTERFFTEDDQARFLGLSDNIVHNGNLSGAVFALSFDVKCIDDQLVISNAQKERRYTSDDYYNYPSINSSNACIKVKLSVRTTVTAEASSQPNFAKPLHNYVSPLRDTLHAIYRQTPFQHNSYAYHRHVEQNTVYCLHRMKTLTGITGFQTCMWYLYFALQHEEQVPSPLPLTPRVFLNAKDIYHQSHLMLMNSALEHSSEHTLNKSCPRQTIVFFHPSDFLELASKQHSLILKDYVFHGMSLKASITLAGDLFDAGLIAVTFPADRTTMTNEEFDQFVHRLAFMYSVKEAVKSAPKRYQGIAYFPGTTVFDANSTDELDILHRRPKTQVFV